MKKYITANKLIIVGIATLGLGFVGAWVGFGNSLAGNPCGVADLPDLIMHGAAFFSRHYCGDPVVIESIPENINVVLSIILNFFFWLLPLSLGTVITGLVIKLKNRTKK